MSLPSQQRSFGSRVSRGRGRGRPGGSARLVGGAVLLLAAVGGGWLLLGGEAPTPAEPGTAQGAPETDLTEPLPRSEARSPEDDVPLVVDSDDGFVETRVVRAPADEPTQPVRPATIDRERRSASLVAADRNRETVTEQGSESVQPTGDVAQWMATAREHLGSGDLIAAREALNSALRVPGADERELAVVMTDLSSLNAELFFGPKVYEGDPIAATYTIEPGDSLQGITNKLGLACDWRLIQRINKIQSPNRIRVGQQLKVVQGPFHAVIDKSAYRLDVYAGPPGSAEQWLFIRSFDVGLGEDNSTPVGRFIVRPDSKLINPVWRNPRTGEFFGADDPENPIGEHWLGLEGTGEVAHVEGYGIHGTIEPESIGMDASMGCVRLVAEDVAIVYEMLEESVSEVYIRP